MLHGSNNSEKPMENAHCIQIKTHELSEALASIDTAMAYGSRCRDIDLSLDSRGLDRISKFGFSYSCQWTLYHKKSKLSHSIRSDLE